MNFMRGESPAHEYIGKVNVRMRNQGQLLKVSCTVLFCLFTFFYIYTYQCDLISYGQMVLSEGKTHFDRTIGSLLLTVALYMVQLFVNGLVRPHDRFVALTFFPYPHLHHRYTKRYRPVVLSGWLDVGRSPSFVAFFIPCLVTPTVVCAVATKQHLFLP